MCGEGCLSVQDADSKSDEGSYLPFQLRPSPPLSVFQMGSICQDRKTWSHKKVENLEHAVALHFMWYNFARPHSSLGSLTTPAMAAGVADHVWSAEEIVSLANSN